MPFLFLPSILGPMNSDLDKLHMLDTDLEHMQSSGEPGPRPEKYCHLPSTLIECSKGHATILSNQLHQDGGDMIRLINSMSTSFIVK